MPPDQAVLGDVLIVCSRITENAFASRTALDVFARFFSEERPPHFIQNAVGIWSVLLQYGPPSFFELSCRVDFLAVVKRLVLDRRAREDDSVEWVVDAIGFAVDGKCRNNPASFPLMQIWMDLKPVEASFDVGDVSFCQTWPALNLFDRVYRSARLNLRIPSLSILRACFAVEQMPKTLST